jgi:Tol biopolymer transport system component
MTGTWPRRWRRRTAVALSVVLGLLLVSCDKRALPTQPTDPGPGLPPGPQGQRSTGPIAFVSDRDGTDWIYLANEDGSAATPLVIGEEPAWAKDGRQVAFHVAGAWTIHAIAVDGSGGRFIVNGGSPAWSPDGRSLVFESWRDSDSDIDLVNLDGSNRRSVFDSGGYGSFRPTWSPDGQRILFSVGTYVDFNLGLWIVNADGSGARQFGGGDFCDAESPAWSPDGSEIAFVGFGGIEVARADGSGRHLRVPGPASDPDWTPDGRLIYTKGAPDGPARVFISDGGIERQLIPDASAPVRPSYRDSQAVWLR